MLTWCFFYRSPVRERVGRTGGGEIESSDVFSLSPSTGDTRTGSAGGAAAPDFDTSGASRVWLGARVRSYVRGVKTPKTLALIDGFLGSSNIMVRP